MLRQLVPSIVRRRYAARLLVLLVVTLGVIGTVGFFTLSGVQADVASVQEDSANVQDAVAQNAQDQLTSTAEIQADAVGNWISRMKLVTGTIAGAQEVTGSNDETRRQYISGTGNTISANVKNVHYLDIPNDSILVSTSPNGSLGGEPLSSFSSSFAAEVRKIDWGSLGQSRVWVSDSIYETGVLGDEVMLFATKVEGNPNRAILVEAEIKNRVNALYDPESEQATSIVTQSGAVVVRGRNASAEADFSPKGSLAAESARTGTTVYDEGENYVYAYAAVSFDGDDRIQEDETPKFVAVTTVPKERAFALQNTVTAALQKTTGALQSTTTSLLLIIAVALLALGGFGAAIGYQTIRPLSRLRDRAEKMENGDLDVDLETSREDEIGRLYDSFAAMRDSLKDRITEATRARQEAERSREEVERLNEHLERKADHYSEVMNTCAGGDLTARMDAESDNESMTEIAEAFNAMLDDIERTVAQVTQFSTAVATESEEVTASAEEVRNASQQVTESIQEISDGAADQDQRLQAVSSEMSSLSTTTEEIASSSNEVASIAERTAETGREGREAAEDAAEGMAEIRERSAAIVEAAEQLESEMAGVDELTEFIAGVAKETNMLALNANIEASRAGSGEGDEEGFGVVAEQIKELAEETQDATAEIEERLDQIQERMDTTVSEVRKSDAAIENNAESIENAIAALDDVAEFAQETNDGIQEISAATEEQASSVQEVVAMVDEVSTISQRTADEAETVASAAEEQTAAMNDVSDSASDLARQAAELSDALDRFTVDAGGPGGDSSVAPPEESTGGE